MTVMIKKVLDQTQTLKPEEKLKNILTGDGFESVANKISQL